MMPQEPFRTRIANKWTGHACLLDGQQARITGRLNDFASIAPLDPRIGCVEYTWDGVNEIMEGDRRFRSY